jgi:PAS domain S-box-containing protein
MAPVGHSTGDMAGRFTGVDAAFCEMLKTPMERLVGARILDVTAPDHRETNLALMHKIQRDGKPFTMVKRYLRGDGSGVWVHNDISLIRISGGEAQYIATTRQLALSHDPGRMQDFLHGARLLYKSRRLRADIFGRNLFSDPAWDALLAAYVAECEGRELRASAMWRDIGLPRVTGARWLKVLEERDLVECEPRAGDYSDDCAVRLTIDGQARLERHIGELFAWHEGRVKQLADTGRMRPTDFE